jgi:hypothetical protein
VDRRHRRRALRQFTHPGDQVEHPRHARDVHEVDRDPEARDLEDRVVAVAFVGRDDEVRLQGDEHFQAG